MLSIQRKVRHLTEDFLLPHMQAIKANELRILVVAFFMCKQYYIMLIRSSLCAAVKRSLAEM